MMSNCNGEQGLEKQMGCMSGFLNLFDRHQMHPAKRIYAPKRLSPPPDMDSSSFSSSSSSKLAVSPASTPELHQLKSSPECVKSPAISSETKIPAEGSGRMTRPFAVFDLKEGSRSPATTLKFREFPRLSLDSRAVVDGKGSLRPREIRTAAPFFSDNQCDDAAERQRRSPSVVARLMGLEALPEHGGVNRDKKGEEDEHFQRPQLRRSASESRSRDLMQYQHNEERSPIQEKYNSGAKAASKSPVRRSTAATEFPNRKPIADEGFPSVKSRQQQHRKSFFDSQELYPEVKQATRSLYGEIEKRLKLRGIEEPEKDLETLKQILEALQLKGLLHSNNKSVVASQIGNHQRNCNYVFDRRFSCADSRIIVVQPSRFPYSPTRAGRTGADSVQANIKSKIESRRKVNVQPNRTDSGRSSPENHRIRNGLTMSPDRSPSSASRRNPKPPLTIETQIRRGNESRISTNTALSPKITIRSPKNNINNNSKSSTNRSRNSRHSGDSSAETRQKSRAPRVSEDESSSISESSISSTPQINLAELRGGKGEEKSVLERCDELLQSIAEMNGANESQQPSPVSVLDSSFYKDDSSSPPPVFNRCLPFKDRFVELEDENQSASPVIAPLQYKSPEQDEHSIHDSDFLYISEVLQTMDCVSDDSEFFFLLEEQKYKSDSSYVSRLHRKLILDVVAEIIDKKRQLPPWKAVSCTDPTTGKPWLHEIWSDFLRFRENGLVAKDFIDGLLRLDMGRDSTVGWRDSPILMSEVVLDVERWIYKDLMGETIRNLAGKHRACAWRRMLLF